MTRGSAPDGAATVIAAIDRQRPTSREALARIAGLGPSKIARFGDDILAVVHRHAAGGATAGDA